MKKTGLIFIVILLSGIFFFREGNFSYSGNSLTINQSKIILNNPSWNITSKKSSSSYKLTSNKAQQNDSDEVFFIEEPSLKTLSSNQIERSISSKKAKLELYKEELIMEKKEWQSKCKTLKESFHSHININSMQMFSLSLIHI